MVCVSQNSSWWLGGDFCSKNTPDSSNYCLRLHDGGDFVSTLSHRLQSAGPEHSRGLAGLKSPARLHGAFESKTTTVAT